jgi:hypothetical protein
MYARIVRWEGEKDELDGMLEQIRQDSAQGPPEGVPSTGFQVFRSLDGSATYGIGLFETEEDLRTGDATLNSMTPPGDMGSIRRTNVDLAELALELSAD